MWYLDSNDTLTQHRQTVKDLLHTVIIVLNYSR
jgi:hypothetical protein